MGNIRASADVQACNINNIMQKDRYNGYIIQEDTVNRR